jgi:hypothetical protein
MNHRSMRLLTVLLCTFALSTIVAGPIDARARTSRSTRMIKRRLLSARQCRYCHQ